MPCRGQAPSIEKELDFRANGGIEVALLWREGYEHLIVELVDTKAAHTFRLEVTATEALEAFHHPYAYAASLGVEYPEPRHVPVGPTPA
jgi:hypothetical protein